MESEQTFMPIPPDQINSDFIILEPTATVREARDAVPWERRRILWIVTPLGGRNYAVFKVGELSAFLQEMTQRDYATRSDLNLTLGSLEKFVELYGREAVDVGANWNKVRETWNALSDPPLVVLENGKILGILKSTRRGGADASDWLNTTNGEPKSANGGPKEEAPPPLGAPKNGGGDSEMVPPDVDEPKMTEPGGTLGPTDAIVAPPPPARRLNARFIGHDVNAPLVVGETYKLGFSVQVEKLADALADAALKESPDWFPAGTEQVVLTVQLLSDDFEVFTDPQKLFVPRTGKSRNEASFDIAPRHNGASEVTAVILKDNNAVQSMTLEFDVGAAGGAAAAKTTTLGRNLEAMAEVRARDVNLWIDYTGNEFQARLTGPAAWSAKLPITKEEVALAVEQARAALEHIVDYEGNNGALVYQFVETAIPPEVYQETLPRVAEAGWLLFNTIFFPPAADDATKKLGGLIQKMAREEARLNIQIVSKEMLLPWGMMYMADEFDPNNVDPNLFLGARHVIEHLPMEADMNFRQTISSKPALTVGLNLNPDIDRQFKLKVIEQQENYFAGLTQNSAIQIVERKNGDDIFNAWTDTKTPDQIAYFYCHANSMTLAQGGAPENRLEFGEGRWIFTLKDFMLRAPNKTRVPNAPLVFLNACQSAQLSPLFYNGFMPYFVSKGARGMIGTECSVPANFAAEFAQRFFQEFFKGKTVGTVMLELRQEYLFQKRNILGLLYALYCDADTQIAPPLN